MWYCLDEFGIGVWARNSPDGHVKAYISFDDVASLLSVESTALLFKSSAKVGESWKLKPDDPDGIEQPNNQRIVVAKVDHPTKVPAGEFSCVVFEFDAASTRFYVAPGIGIVKYEYPTGLLGDGNSEVFELTKFERAGD
ncbi:MAG: hypothetical protein IH991_17740 [Planctomycetes bacterium]|nr:hypothetical protein [Planctomycetota bacterium]